MSTITVRRATISDVDEISAIERESFTDPWSWELLMKDVADNDISVYLVAVENGHVIGYIGFWFVESECQINNVAVRKDRRGDNIGALLVNTALSITKGLGVNYWTLEVRDSNMAAISLYKKCGFEIVGKREKYYDDGEDALLMSRGKIYAE